MTVEPCLILLSAPSLIPIRCLVAYITDHRSHSSIGRLSSVSNMKQYNWSSRGQSLHTDSEDWGLKVCWHRPLSYNCPIHTTNRSCGHGILAVSSLCPCSTRQWVTSRTLCGQSSSVHFGSSVVFMLTDRPALDSGSY